MLFMLARVAPNLSEAHVEKEPSDAGVGQNRVENFAAFRVSVPAFINILANDASGERRAVAVCLIDKTSEGVCNTAQRPLYRGARTRPDRASQGSQGPSRASLQCRKSVRRSSLA